MILRTVTTDVVRFIGNEMSAENPDGHAETPLAGVLEWRLDPRRQWGIGFESELY